MLISDHDQVLKACDKPLSLQGYLKAVLGPLFYIVIVVALAQLMGLRPAQADSITEAENWFNNLTTYQAKFTQVSSDGSHATGVFSMRRPYRSRFEYDDPVPLVLITSKTWLHVDEEDRREVTSYPLSETPLGLLLDDPVRLRSPDFTTSSGVQDGILFIAIEQEDGEAAGKIVMEFTQDPIELRRWVITDANGITTSVFLTDPIKGKKLANKLFVPTEYIDQSNNN